MAYAALVSLANTIDRFLNNNLYHNSLEEKQQITSLLEYVTPFQHFLDEFPDKFNGLEGRMRDLANEAEDILEYLVLEKVYLCSDEESEPRDLNRVTVIKDFNLKQEKLYEEFREGFGKAFKGRIWDVANAAKHVNNFLRWEKDHIRFRDKWRYLPAEFAKFKSTPHFIDHLNKIGNEIDLIMAEVMAIENNSDATSSSAGSHDKTRFLPAMFPKFKFRNHMKTMRKEFNSVAGKVMSMKKNKCATIKEDMVQLGDSAAAAASSSGTDLHDDDEEEEDEESECYRSAKQELQLKRVMKEIALIAAQAKEITHSSSSKDVQRGADTSTLSSSSTNPPIQKDSMVGFEDYVLDMKDHLCGEPSNKLQVIPICGMGGIGKTTLARNLYDDPLIVSHFDVRVWVTISQDYSAQRIISSLVESLKEFGTGRLGGSDDKKVHKILIGRRYLVVMDDTWSSEAWDIVRRVLPNDCNGSRVMLTTRLSDVASYPDPSSRIHEMSLLSADESWDLFKHKVFANEDCPYELENIGKEIAGSCKGLPLAVVVITGFVSTTTRNLVSWEVIGETVKHAEHDQIQDILSLSYAHLPQYLRPCFLYMGSFPGDREIQVEKLIRLWIAEGFVKSPISSDSFEKVAEECLEELIKRNLVLVRKREWDGRIKSCSLHDLIRDLCIRKSYESKFFFNLMDRHIGKEGIIENLRNQRLISVYSTNLEIFSSLHGSTIRSIKCFWHDIGRLKVLKSVRLLRVLDVEAFDAHNLPTLAHLDELFHLRYLTVASYEDIPTSLLMLQNLQTLVIHVPYSVGILNRVLMLKWRMSQLRHVCYDGGIVDFDDPEETDCPLECLQTLSYVSHSTCRETILKMVPNLKKLGIDCSKGLPHDGGACPDDLVHLHQLEDLEIYAREQPNCSKITFPRMLKKLIFRWCTLPWNDIFVSGSLPNLQVLKLLRCTCVGGSWETTEGAFPVLEVLEISSKTFKNWVTESSHFPRLKLLLLHDCEYLNGIPNDIGDIPTLQLIEVKSFMEGFVRKSLIESVELIREEQEDMGNNTLQVVCNASPDYDVLST